MMSWTSFDMILFFPIVIMIYFLFPVRYAWLWLLAASYLFCCSWGRSACVALIFITLVSYAGGLLLGKLLMGEKEGKGTVRIICAAAGIAICAGPLLFCKLMGLFSADMGLLLPVGMSFYVLQAVGYMADVCRKKYRPERNLFKYALYLSFFPKFISGPVERADHFLDQVGRQRASFEYERVRSGLFLMLWGYFQKLVIADILAVSVDAVYGDWNSCSGLTILAATAAFAIQLYADFAGYSNIAAGAAQVVGYQLEINFKQPYFADSIQDFWRRWHISLSSWLRDYIYIPLGGSRKGNLRKKGNLLITFLVSGLWHGVGWTYLIWGMLHGCYQIVGEYHQRFREKLMDREIPGWIRMLCRILQRCVLFVLVDFAWLFFRADHVKTAFYMLKKCVTDIGEMGVGGETVWNLGLYREEVWVLGIAILLLTVVDCLHEKGVGIRNWLFQRPALIRWSCYLGLFFVVAVAATRQMGPDASQFIYAQF